jgi:hypothetical protein
MNGEPAKEAAGAERSMSVWRFRLLMFSISLISGLAGGHSASEYP